MCLLQGGERESFTYLKIFKFIQMLTSLKEQPGAIKWKEIEIITSFFILRCLTPDEPKEKEVKHLNHWKVLYTYIDNLFTLQNKCSVCQ